MRKQRERRTEKTTSVFSALSCSKICLLSFNELQQFRCVCPERFGEHFLNSQLPGLKGRWKLASHEVAGMVEK
jgi:hypothetical protein